MKQEKSISVFAEDVLEGLSAKEKYLSSKYFYDSVGDELFIKIMNSQEYYLTNAELEIFKEQSTAIFKAIQWLNKPKRVIELGAGDGTKTVHLLRSFLAQDLSFTYTPIDISSNAICLIENNLKRHLPSLVFEGRTGDYFTMLDQDTKNQEEQKLVLFLGSNMGNMNHFKSQAFLKKLASHLHQGDYLLLGLDVKKSKKIVLPAYNDSHGYTRDFNLNILARINRELNGNFDLDNFEHVPKYIEQTGTAISYLKSKQDQQVFIGELNTTFSFNKNELIHTEISQKYDQDTLSQILTDTGLFVSEYFYDRQQYFMNVLLKKQ